MVLCLLMLRSIAQVEDYLKEAIKPSEDKTDTGGASLHDEADIQFTDFHFGGGLSDPGSKSRSTSDTPQAPQTGPTCDWRDQPGNEFYDFQLMGLGMTESLPPQKLMEEL